ncbi:hypothetical protein GN316_03060 [Xylophilus sp. Kf1]|nr:hypothetical protein [Xylophilus sp. Kf1]
MIFTNSPRSRILAACVLPMGAVLRLGGDSSSATTSTTDVRDMRVVGGDSSANVSANNSEISVFSTDHGAINGGLTLASQGVAAAVKSGDTLAATLGSMFDKALTFASDTNKSSTAQVASAYGSVASGLQGAYSESRAPDTGILKIAAIAAVLIVGVLAYASTKRG